MVTPVSHAIFRAFFSFGFGLATFYFLIWTILASTVPDFKAMGYFLGCSLLSGIGSVYFLICFRKSDIDLPKAQSMIFYTTMAVFSVALGALLFVHIESYNSIPDRMRIPTQILTVVVYLVFLVFTLIRLSESRFLPSATKVQKSGELLK